MSQQIKLEVQPRTMFGRKVKRLRQDGVLPGNIFGTKTKSTAIQLDQTKFMSLYKEAGETNIIQLTLESKTNPVLISSVQLDPVTDTPIHVDFRQVDLTQTITANIPVEIIGESPAVKEGGGVLETPLSEIEVEALPTDLPETLEIDISEIKEVGESLTASDLKLPAKVKLLTEPDTTIVVVSEPKEEEVEEPEPTEEAIADTESKQEGKSSPESQPAEPDSPDQQAAKSE